MARKSTPAVQNKNDIDEAALQAGSKRTVACFREHCASSGNDGRPPAV